MADTKNKAEEEKMLNIALEKRQAFMFFCVKLGLDTQVISGQWDTYIYN